MALPVTGSRLLAEDASKYVADMNRGKKANEDFGESAKKGSIGANALSVGIGNILSAGVLKVADGLYRAGKVGVEAFAGSIKGAAALEAQMSGVAAVLGGTHDDLAQLKQLTLDLGIDPTLKVSSVEAAEAIEMLAKNGLDMQTIMDGAAKATVALANATGGDFAQAADIMTDAAAIFGFQGNEMIDVVAGITAVTNSSKFGIQDYALALANGGDVAAKAGVPFDEFNTTIAAISPSFSSGMTAGTSFNNFLLRLTPNSEAAKDAMRELNLVTDEGKSVFFDAQGNLRSMADISGILQEALSGLSAEQRTQALRTIFGNDAMGAAIALAEVGRERFLELGDSMALIDPNAAAAMRMDNFAGAMEILDGVIESVSLQVGEKFLPALTRLARVAASFIEENADKFIAFFERGAELVDIFATELSNGATPAEAFRTALAKVTDPATLARWDEYVKTGERVLGTLKDLATWASQNGPTIVNVLKGIGIALVTIKTITTVAAGVQAFTAAWVAGSAAFTAAGGGLSGLVALMGGPLLVVTAAAALAIAGLVIVINDLKQQSREFDAIIDEQASSLRQISRETGDYTAEAGKLVNALELSSTGLGVFTFQADDMRAQITSLIAETGDFSGGLEELEASLQTVFEGNVQVTEQFVLLDGKTIALTDDVLELGRQYEQSATATRFLAENTDMLATSLDGEATAVGVVSQANEELHERIAMTDALRQDGIVTVEDQIAAIWAEQAALQAEAEAQQAAGEAAQRAADIRRQVTGVIQAAMSDQAGLVRDLITATQELETAEMNLAAAPWDTDLIQKAESARDNLSSAFDAIAESHRQMVMDIYVRNAELEGGFDKSAANIAVALGLMTEAEAQMRLEAVHTAEQIGYLSDQMIQTFLEDGTVSREEAAQLAKAIRAIEESSATADEVLDRFANQGMAGAEQAAKDAAAAIVTTGTDLLKLGPAAEASATAVKEAYEREDWYGVGDSISGGVKAGVEGKAGEIAAAAVAVVSGAINAARAAARAESPSKESKEMVGEPIGQGIAEGLWTTMPIIEDAIIGVVLDPIEWMGGEVKEKGKEIGEEAGSKIGDGLAKGKPIVQEELDDYVEIVADTVSTMAASLGTWAGTLEDSVGGLFDLAGPFSALGNTAVKRFQDSVLNPLLERSSWMEDRVALLQKNIANEIGRADFFKGGGTFVELQQLARGELAGGTPRAVREAAQLLQLYGQQAEVSEQIRQEQERIAELQRAQADLQFLQQQLQIVSLIEEHGLSADLLGGLQVGIDADAGAVIEAMTNVIRAIIEAAQQEAGIASPSKVFRGIAGQIVAGLTDGLALGETAVSGQMRRLITGMESAAIMPPATAAQTFSTAVNQNIDRSMNIQIENRSGGAPVNDVDQLAFLWATYAT